MHPYHPFIAAALASEHDPELRAQAASWRRTPGPGFRAGNALAAGSQRLAARCARPSFRWTGPGRARRGGRARDGSGTDSGGRAA